MCEGRRKPSRRSSAAHYRREKIIELLQFFVVRTQTALRALLVQHHGIHVQQATLSRDLSALRCYRGYGPEGTHQYILPASQCADGGSSCDHS